ncbi:NAD(+) kinase [Marinimicrobium alkaliphilum]|uniref:NAD(+) kinase n=1 Tax=Marinimicrobium alkaliphilum TaxID=2202654 RepID=UPI000DB9F0B5|nr:NAD(+) kinase [Marinimicrobium alkaliphilum]
MTAFATIGLIGRLDNERARYSMERLITFLQSRQLDFTLESQTAAVLGSDAAVGAARQVAELDSLGRHCDLVIVVGGDGSLLGAARALTSYGVPLLGVNRGRLGFLTDITPEDIEEKVGEVLDGHYLEESRFLLNMEVRRGGRLMGRGDALNDVVMHPGEFIHMLEFELSIDGHFVTSQCADGMIVSTPTGSTAYALSGGGPIMHPKLDAIGLVPMNPHTLSSRPMVIDGNSEIKITVGQSRGSKAMVTCDGQIHVESRTGDEIFIHKKPQKLTLIHPLNHNFYERCRTKLGWGGHLLD